MLLTKMQTNLNDGTYTVDVALGGGSGRASITSPAKLTVADGETTVEILWSSSHYDYMLVDGKTYLPVSTEGNSVFQLPVTVYDQEIEVIADTTAMSAPHEITYTLRLDSASIQRTGFSHLVIPVAIALCVGIIVILVLIKRDRMKTYKTS
ncbi:MAG: hypothetical protein PHE02_07145 [Lachnospiraceae bacterium]|nr:hypothetical protein [Lachnospiraceae bacterium]